jgi:O-antigen/teichoic acid export membrane protein
LQFRLTVTSAANDDLPVTEVATEAAQLRMTRSLTGRTFWLAASKSVAYALNLAVPLILVRRMSRDEYGTYMQAFQIVTTAVTLLPLGFGLTAYYFLPREPEARGRVIKNIVMVIGSLGAVALALFTLVPETAYRLTGNPAVSAYGALIGLVIFFWVWSGFLETAVLANEEPLLAPVLVITSQVIRTGLMLAAALWSANLRSLLLASLLHGVVQSLVMLWYLSSRFPGFWRGFDRDLLRRQIVYAGPYTLTALLWIIQTDLHAFVVSNGFGEDRFAIYRVACIQIPFVSLLGESVNAVLIPRVVDLQHAGRMNELRALLARVVRLLAMAFLPLFVVLLVLNQEFITGLFTTKYAESSLLFVVFLTLLPTNIITVDAVVRAFPSLGSFAFRLRLVLVLAMLLALWVGVRTLDLLGIAILTVAFSQLERVILSIRTAQTLHLGRADFRAMSDVGKVVLASVIAATVTVALRELMSDLRPLFVLIIAGSAFYAVFIAAGFWLKLPTADERRQINTWYNRIRAALS